MSTELPILRSQLSGVRAQGRRAGLLTAPAEAVAGLGVPGLRRAREPVRPGGLVHLHLAAIAQAQGMAGQAWGSAARLPPPEVLSWLAPHVYIASSLCIGFHSQASSRSGRVAVPREGGTPEPLLPSASPRPVVPCPVVCGAWSLPRGPYYCWLRLCKRKSSLFSLFKNRPPMENPA